MSRISQHPTERDRYGLNMALAAFARREQLYPGAADLVRCLLDQIDNEHAAKEPGYDALLCEVGALRKDAERLDWMDGYIVSADSEDTGKIAFSSSRGALRECVDAAMAAKEA